MKKAIAIAMVVISLSCVLLTHHFLKSMDGFQRLTELNTEEKDGFILFQKIVLNLSANKYELHPLTEADKNKLPMVLENCGFEYIIFEDKIYVEKELMTNPDFISKVVGQLNGEYF